jgi:formylglycine-generating enzyme required for sulfatase activity
VYYYDSACTTVAKDSDPSSNFVKENVSYIHRTAYAKPGATGFRLPGSKEWELAARWRNDSTNTVGGYTDPYFTKGNSASGATADTSNATATGEVAWYSGNSSGTTHAVKGRDANALGLYDMSGNIWEQCYERTTGDGRIIQGGSYTNNADPLRVGNMGTAVPIHQIGIIGFRPARTVQ